MSRVDRSTAPRPAPVRDFNFPIVRRTCLPNELTVLTAQQGRLPVVTLMLVVHAGAEHDERATSGLAELTARMLEAGTTRNPADRVAWGFEMLGAELDVTVMWDCAVLSVTVPADRVGPALALLADVATDPAFARAEFERVKAELLSELEQRRAEPGALANDMASHFIFAPDVPYARPVPGTPASVRNLTDMHVRDFYQRQWTSSNAALIAVGDLTHEQIEDLAAGHFAAWAARPRQIADFEPTSPIERTQVFIVDRDGSVQSELRVGHVGVPRSSPDYFAITIANGVLGGIFTSRLNMNLREKHGFTYGVRSGYGFRKKPGPFLIQTAVASDVTARALQELLHETRRLVRDGLTDDEIFATREYLAGVMPLEMQTTAQMAKRISDIFVYELSDDYLPQHRAALLTVSREAAERAARDHIKLDQLAIVIIGDAKAIETEIAALNTGPIEVHSIEG